MTEADIKPTSMRGDVLSSRRVQGRRRQIQELRAEVSKVNQMRGTEESQGSSSEEVAFKGDQQGHLGGSVG